MPPRTNDLLTVIRTVAAVVSAVVASVILWRLYHH